MRTTETVLLASPAIQIGTHWKDAKELLLQTSEIKELLEQAKASGPIDEWGARIAILDAFAKTIDRYDQEDEQKRTKMAKDQRRKERKNRDHFRALLREMREAGTITPVSTWSELYPSIKNDSRFTNMLGQKGSTPLELFWDEVELLNEQVYDARKALEADLKALKIKVTSKTTLDELKSIVDSPEVKASIDPSVLPFVHEQLLIKAKRREREEEERQERRKRKLLDYLKQDMRDLSPPLTADSTWEEEKRRISDIKVYKELGDEEAARRVFDYVIDRLKESQKHKRSRAGSITSEKTVSSERPQPVNTDNKDAAMEVEHGSDSQMEEGEERI
ncbi:U1 snRNP protein [Spiromyces aspiralis]|uniref:U1 snRNP protein n=1 Tax=Spiromyces aspiralis TaxID=68401 RepID=A0ACC1HUH5_9FUNG|nr:U1 snRNP protein [Spiromyces aspiralis]